jgi:hypothetical protein
MPGRSDNDVKNRWHRKTRNDPALMTQNQGVAYPSIAPNAKKDKAGERAAASAAGDDEVDRGRDVATTATTSADGTTTADGAAMAGVVRDSLVASGYRINICGGAYRAGTARSLGEKASVAAAYLELRARDPSVSMRAVARAARVSNGFAKKVMAEVNAGKLVGPKTAAERACKRGIGSKTISRENSSVLLALREEAERIGRDGDREGDGGGKRRRRMTMQDYSDRLFESTRNRVSKQVICRWFLKGGGAARGAIGAPCIGGGGEGRGGGRGGGGSGENEGEAAVINRDTGVPVDDRPCG